MVAALTTARCNKTLEKGGGYPFRAEAGGEYKKAIKLSGFEPVTRGNPRRLAAERATARARRHHAVVRGKRARGENGGAEAHLQKQRKTAKSPTACGASYLSGTMVPRGGPGRADSRTAVP